MSTQASLKAHAVSSVRNCFLLLLESPTLRLQDSILSPTPVPGLPGTQHFALISTSFYCIPLLSCELVMCLPSLLSPLNPELHPCPATNTKTTQTSVSPSRWKEETGVYESASSFLAPGLVQNSFICLVWLLWNDKLSLVDGTGGDLVFFALNCDTFL